jgi:3',5'-cyclic-AMP phosphodiesterase
VVPGTSPDQSGAHPPTILVQLSDLHLRAGEQGAGAARRLERAVGQLATLQPSPTAVLISGDLVDEPSSEAYEQARGILLEFGLPLYAIPGNHDDRDMLREHFGPSPAPSGSAVNLAVDCGDLRLVGLDSLRPGSDAGSLGCEQLEWLAETLAQETERPTLLALHHPPVMSGIRAMDQIALNAEDSTALEALIRGQVQVQAITCGHAHTTMISTFAGRPLLICPSTNSAVLLDLRPREDLPFSVAPLPLGFAVHALEAGRLVSHVQPVRRVHGD